MVAQPKPRYVMPEEYLAWEDKAQTKHEYYDGVIVAMAGASPEHNILVFDLTVLLGTQLRGGDCQGFASDLRLRVPECNTYFYPDIAVVCGEPEYEVVAGLRALLNPTLIIEVLSGSTERADRTEKFDCYRTLKTLTTYVLVAQDTPRIEVFTHEPDGSWRHRVARGLDDVLSLGAIGCELRLAEVYARVEFPPAPALETAE